MITYKTPTKEILAIGKYFYRNFTIFDNGFHLTIFVGVESHKFYSYAEATAWIDSWYAARQA